MAGVALLLALAGCGAPTASGPTTTKAPMDRSDVAGVSVWSSCDQWGRRVYIYTVESGPALAVVDAPECPKPKP